LRILTTPSNNQEENLLMSLRRIGSAISLLLLSLSTTAAFAADAKTVPAAPAAAERYGTWGFDLAGMDRTVKPGDDFFKYVNGAWLAKTEIPADKTAYGAFAVLGDLSEVRVHALLDKWGADKSLKAGSDEAKVAAIYRTFLDDATAEKLDAKPLQPYLDSIRKATTYDDVARLMGRSAGALGS
jgi:putative endopeptidase